jgi:hypothetical protein
MSSYTRAIFKKDVSISIVGIQLRLQVSEVIQATKKFMTEQTGYQYFTVVEVKADEAKFRWLVYVDVGLFGVRKKEIIVDDKDGNIIGYRAITT